MSKFEEAKFNPSSFYSSPKELLDDKTFDTKQKIEILRSWEFDARELEVAEEENMGGGQPDILDEIFKALKELGSGPDVEDTPPTKQGGE